MIQSYLLDHQPRLKRLCSGYTKQYEKALAKDPLFEEEITSQYLNNCKKIFVDEVTKALACSAEDVMIVLESMYIEGYLE